MNSRTKKTIEFRIFKGTLDFHRLIGCFQFVDAVTEYIKRINPLEASEGDWIAFKQWAVKNGKFEHLIRHMRKVGA